MVRLRTAEEEAEEEGEISYLTISLAVASELSFPGGGGSEFVRALSYQTQMPVVAEYDPHWRLTKLRIKDPLSKRGWEAVCSSSKKYNSTIGNPPKGVAFYGGGYWDLNFYVDRRVGPEFRNVIRVKPNQRIDSKYSRVATVSDILQHAGRPASAHWFVKDFFVHYESPKGVSDLDFLQCLASAVGGKPVWSNGSLYVDIDPKAVLTRIKGIPAQGDSKLERAERDLTVAVYGELDERRIVEIYKTKASEYRLRAKRNDRLWQSGISRIQARKETDGLNPAVLEVIEQIDWNQGMELIIRPGRTVTQRFRLLSGTYLTI